MARQDLTGFEIDSFGERVGTRKITLTLSNPGHLHNSFPEDKVVVRIEDDNGIEVDWDELQAAVKSLDPDQPKRA